MTESARILFRHFVQAGVAARARKTRTKPPSRGFVHFVHAPEHRCGEPTRRRDGQPPRAPPLECRSIRPSLWAADRPKPSAP
jgi:hypothetical protein